MSPRPKLRAIVDAIGNGIDSIAVWAVDSKVIGSVFVESEDKFRNESYWIALSPSIDSMECVANSRITNRDQTKVFSVV